jgi:hypothetical protein
MLELITGTLDYVGDIYDDSIPQDLALDSEPTIHPLSTFFYYENNAANLYTNFQDLSEFCRVSVRAPRLLNYGYVLDIGVSETEDYTAEALHVVTAATIVIRASKILRASRRHESLVVSRHEINANVEYTSSDESDLEGTNFDAELTDEIFNDTDAPSSAERAAQIAEIAHTPQLWDILFLHLFTFSFTPPRHSSFPATNPLGIIQHVLSQHNCSPISYQGVLIPKLWRFALYAWVTSNLGFLLARHISKRQMLSFYAKLSGQLLLTFQTKFCILSRRLRKIMRSGQKYRQTFNHVRASRRLTATGRFISYFTKFSPQPRYKARLRQLLFDVLLEPENALLLVARKTQQVSVLTKLLRA